MLRRLCSLATVGCVALVAQPSLATPVLSIPLDQLILSVSPEDSSPDAMRKIRNNASMFSLILGKAERLYRNGDREPRICIVPDGDSPVPENMIKEAKSYGYDLQLDPSHKVCKS